MFLFVDRRAAAQLEARLHKYYALLSPAHKNTHHALTDPYSQLFLIQSIGALRVSRPELLVNGCDSFPVKHEPIDCLFGSDSCVSWDPELWNVIAPSIAGIGVFAAGDGPCTVLRKLHEDGDEVQELSSVIFDVGHLSSIAIGQCFALSLVCILEAGDSYLLQAHFIILGVD